MSQYDEMDDQAKKEARRDAAQFIGILFVLPVLGIWWATTFLV
ncbi:MAG: hypothetical protein AAF763_07805 [Pseudomonadota bacterium]